MPGLLSGATLFVLGDAALVTDVLATLTASGVRAIAVDSLPEQASACLDLRALAHMESPETGQAINRDAFMLARRWAQNANSAQSTPVLVSVYDCGGGFGLRPIPAGRAWAAGLSALLKTCALEHPNASVKCIDLHCAGLSTSQQAQLICQELLTGGGEKEVALGLPRGLETQHGAEAQTLLRERFSLRSVPNAAELHDSALSEGDVLLVSGGARGVTAHCLLALAKRRRLRFILLGRTALTPEAPELAQAHDETALKRVLLALASTKLSPIQLGAQAKQILAMREVRHNIAQLEALGSSVRYLNVDIQSAPELTRALAPIRAEWGDIHALVHAAGVIADKRVAELSDGQFDAVFDTKVKALQALLGCCEQEPLKVLAVFSSVSARCGNTGQAAYAMANEIMAKVMLDYARQRPGCLVKSFGWGPWESGMVSPALKARFASLGVPMISLARGSEQFALELETRAGMAAEVELVFGGAPRAEALLFDGADVRMERLELRVNAQNYPELPGHQLRGSVVIPMVYVADWFRRAVNGFSPGWQGVEIKHLRALKGISVEGFEDTGMLLSIQAQPLPGGATPSWQLSLRDAQDKPRYSATIELSATPLTPQQAIDPEHLGQLTPWRHGDPYETLLFHRAEFVLIHDILGLDETHMHAQIKPGRFRQRTPGGLDVAALDAGMQIALLFAREKLGVDNLPSEIESIRSFDVAHGAGPLAVQLIHRRQRQDASVSDVLISNADGQRVLELLGVHNFALARAH